MLPCWNSSLPTPALAWLKYSVIPISAKLTTHESDAKNIPQLMMVITDVMVDYSIAILPMFEIGARGLMYPGLQCPVSTPHLHLHCSQSVTFQYWSTSFSNCSLKNGVMSLFPKSCNFLKLKNTLIVTSNRAENERTKPVSHDMWTILKR